MCARPYMLACVCNRERTCGCTGTLLCLYTVSAPSKSNPSIWQEATYNTCAPNDSIKQGPPEGNSIFQAYPCSPDGRDHYVFVDELCVGDCRRLYVDRPLKFVYGLIPMDSQESFARARLAVWFSHYFYSENQHSEYMLRSDNPPPPPPPPPTPPPPLYLLENISYTV